MSFCSNRFSIYFLIFVGLDSKVNDKIASYAVMIEYFAFLNSSKTPISLWYDLLISYRLKNTISLCTAVLALLIKIPSSVTLSIIVLLSGRYSQFYSTVLNQDDYRVTITVGGLPILSNKARVVLF